MTEEICIETSGITLSSLLSEIEQSSTDDQYGLLLGYLSENITKTVTDRDIENVKLHKYINISGVFPFRDQFYDNIGQIDQEKITDYVRNEKNIIGWYHSRRNTDLHLTLREKIIHKSLCNIIDTQVDLFIFCVLTSSYTQNCSKHTYSQTFYRYNYSQFVEVPLHIANLGDSNKLYKNTTRKHHQEGTIDKIVSNIKASTDSSQSMYLINKLEEGIQNYIKNQITQVSNLMDDLNSLEQEIQNFKRKKSQDLMSNSESLNETIIKSQTPPTTLRNRTVNKETKRALNVQLKLTPDGAAAKEKSDTKTKSKVGTPVQTRGRTRSLRDKKDEESEN